MNLVDHNKGLYTSFTDRYASAVNSIKNFVKNLYISSNNKCASAVNRFKSICQQGVSKLKNYSSLSFICLGAIVGAGITFAFGLGLTVLVSKIFPELLFKMVLGMFVSVPTAGVLGGNITLSRLQKSFGVRNDNKFKKIWETSLVSLGTVAGASLASVFGLGILAITGVLLPGLTTSVSLGILTSIPITGISSGIALSKVYKCTSFNFDTNQNNLNSASTQSIPTLSFAKDENNLNLQKNVNLQNNLYSQGNVPNSIKIPKENQHNLVDFKFSR